MAGVVVCHGSTVVRERLVVTSIGVPTLSPVRAAASVDELLAHARRIPPTIVLLDAHIPAPGANEAIRRLRAVAPSAAVVLLAAADDTAALDRALALGARGFLAPDVGRPELSAVAAHVLASPVLPAGPRPVSEVPHPAAPPLADSATGAAGAVANEANAAPEPHPVVLTKREIEVLVGMSNGRSNAQIGQELFLSEDTVKTHARRLFRKLGASDRAQAVAIGLRGGLIR
ncbi:response regulator transcription factor [Cellulomonas sp. PhB150]|uniref:helix-turn-helix transcriptional regulator n=1 Tax=Cellulomonas sp. PhB150 TaxID=2485188 RepID=UPI000F477B64|nr:response regulator transcription factor [Cellulomonas sp. PhB150]ROS31450.1 LuxR family two component transcriptional regulator [Cellulomonas sp. PhB150]